MKALIIRYSAFGDALHASHLPRLLKENGYKTVDLNTNPKGLQIFANNPHINKITCVDTSKDPIASYPASWLYNYYSVISEGYDKVVNLNNSIEYAYLAMEDHRDYYLPTSYRREKFGSKNYYDIAIDYAGLDKKYYGTTGEMYFKEEEEKSVKYFVSKYDDKFKVVINVSGTSLHKLLMDRQKIADEILKEHKDAVILTIGDASCKSLDIEGAVSLVGKIPIRGSILLTKYANCVIGCESGVMVASNMWNTPTIQLMTAANTNNHGKYAKNDFSIQSKAKCSPCHKGPYRYLGCKMINGYPECVYKFDIQEILEKVRECKKCQQVQ